MVYVLLCGLSVGIYVIYLTFRSFRPICYYFVLRVVLIGVYLLIDVCFVGLIRLLCGCCCLLDADCGLGGLLLILAFAFGVV